MPPVKYQRGDTVMGRWPGSSLYYEVTVLGFDTKSQLYTVIYKDGTELELKEQDIKSVAGFQTRSRSRSRSPSRRRSRSRSPARTTRRSSSRTAAAVAAAAITESAPSSRRDTKPRDVVEVTLIPQQKTKPAENNSNNRHEEKEEKQKEENNTASKVNEKAEAQVEAESDKNQGRYNLRRRKDDGDAKLAETRPEQLVEKKYKIPAAPATTLSTPLDFGGKIGAYFWLLFLPAWVLFLVLQVRQKDPSLTNFPPPLPALEAFWDAQALGFVILWILFQALLYILPFIC